METLHHDAAVVFTAADVAQPGCSGVLISVVQQQQA